MSARTGGYDTTAGQPGRPGPDSHHSVHNGRLEGSDTDRSEHDGGSAGASDSAVQPLPGRRLGVDVGTVRVGVALSDALGMLASPLLTLRRSRDGADRRRLAELVAEHEVVEVVVGHPLHLSGASGASADDATAYADQVGSLIAPVPVRLVDERLSTRSASANLRAQGRDARSQRQLIDQAAAAVILQSHLDALAQLPAPTDGKL